MNEGAPIIIKKKKVSGHGHHGGAWKVAYADFVTAMMAFFLVMWIMGMSADQRQQVQGYFNDPQGFMKSVPKGAPNITPSGGHRASQLSASAAATRRKEEEQEEREVEQVRENIKAVLSKGANDADISVLIKNIEVTLTTEGLEIEFVEGKGMVFFEVGCANIRPQAKKLILEIAPLLAKSGRIMIIDGHTDARNYTGLGYDNWDLSGDRALAVRRVLRLGGVPANQVSAVRAFADTRLKFPDAPLDSRNRRVTVMLPFKRMQQNVVNDIPHDQIDPKDQAIFAKPEIVPEKPAKFTTGQKQPVENHSGH